MRGLLMGIRGFCLLGSLVFVLDGACSGSATDVTATGGVTGTITAASGGAAGTATVASGGAPPGSGGFGTAQSTTGAGGTGGDNCGTTTCGSGQVCLCGLWCSHMGGGTYVCPAGGSSSAAGT